MLIPGGFFEELRAHVTGFVAEPERNQWGLAQMAWEGSQKGRQHRTTPGAMSFSAQELDELFGRRKFQPLFRRVDFFQRSPGWSKNEGVTKAYWFSKEVRQALASYAGRSSTEPEDLLYLSGSQMKVARSLPRAVASVGTKGRATSTADWSSAMGMNRVPVNVAMLESLQHWLQAHLLALDLDRTDESLRWVLERLAALAGKLIRMSNTTLAGPGHIPQAYALAPSGRLYARGLNLQNAPKLIKEAALHRLWEYDFSNCHFTIVAQLAAKAGLPCPRIEHYLANKQLVRNEVAEGALITLDQAKRCLLALLYGAKASRLPSTAIPAEIGLDAADRLYALPVFQGLSLEIARARRVILDKWPRTANGSLTNACGRAISGKEKPSRQLAHLVQGVEAKALMTCVNTHPGDIVLMQHDGFTATRGLDCSRLQEALLRSTGLNLQVEERRLELHPDARARLDRIKSEMALEAAPVLGFDSVSDD